MLGGGVASTLHPDYLVITPLSPTDRKLACQVISDTELTTILSVCQGTRRDHLSKFWLWLGGRLGGTWCSW